MSAACLNLLSFAETSDVPELLRRLGVRVYDLLRIADVEAVES